MKGDFTMTSYHSFNADTEKDDDLFEDLPINYDADAIRATYDEDYIRDLKKLGFSWEEILDDDDNDDDDEYFEGDIYENDDYDDYDVDELCEMAWDDAMER